MKIHYFEGNHDLYLRHFFAENLKFSVYTDYAYFDIEGLIVRVEHGDQVDSEDRGYLFLRWFLRTLPMKCIAKILPGALVAQIGTKASEKSRNYTSTSKTIDNDSARAKLHAYAKAKLKERRYDLLVTGHLHVKDDYTWEEANVSYRSINLGTWLEQPGYLEISEGKQTFNILS